MSVASSFESSCEESIDESLFVDGSNSVVQPRATRAASVPVACPDSNGSVDGSVFLEGGSPEEQVRDDDSLSLDSTSYTGIMSDGSATGENSGHVQPDRRADNGQAHTPSKSWMPRWTQHAPRSVKVILAVSVLLLVVSNVLAGVAIVGASRERGSESAPQEPTTAATDLPTSQPQAMPTASPSASPSISPSVSPTITCEDTDGLFIVGGQERDCDHLQLSFALRVIICQPDRGVNELCPKTCGVCGNPSE